MECLIMPLPSWPSTGEYSENTQLGKVPSWCTAGQNTHMHTHTLSHSFNISSAGVGRTGTFITIDHVLEQVGKEGVVDIPGVINNIRHQRMKLVQTVVCLYIHY